MADNNNSNLFSVPEVNEIKRLAGGGGDRLVISDTVVRESGLVTSSNINILNDTWRITNIRISDTIDIPSNAIDVYAYVTLTYSEDSKTKTIVLTSPCTVINNQATSTLGRHVIPNQSYTITSSGLRYRTIS